jgi:hypothetical protein
MNTPNKLNSGDEFRGGVVRAVNAIIDYLKATRIVVDNSTIFANQTPSGMVLSGKKSVPGKSKAPSGYDGPFKVSYDSSDGIIVARGILTRLKWAADYSPGETLGTLYCQRSVIPLTGIAAGIYVVYLVSFGCAWLPVYRLRSYDDVSSRMYSSGTEATIADYYGNVPWVNVPGYTETPIAVIDTSSSGAPVIYQIQYGHIFVPPVPLGYFTPYFSLDWAWSDVAGPVLSGSPLDGKSYKLWYRVQLRKAIKNSDGVVTDFDDDVTYGTLTLTASIDAWMEMHINTTTRAATVDAGNSVPDSSNPSLGLLYRIRHYCVHQYMTGIPTLYY